MDNLSTYVQTWEAKSRLDSHSTMRVWIRLPMSVHWLQMTWISFTRMTSISTYKFQLGIFGENLTADVLNIFKRPLKFWCSFPFEKEKKLLAVTKKIARSEENKCSSILERKWNFSHFTKQLKCWTVVADKKGLYCLAPSALQHSEKCIWEIFGTQCCYFIFKPLLT